MKRSAVIWILLFFASSVAWEGSACGASLQKRKPCCVQCPFRMLPKLGDSCCDRGAENGNFLITFAPASKKPVFLAASLPFQMEKMFFGRPEVIQTSSREVHSIYLFEEHLLL